MDKQNGSISKPGLDDKKEEAELANQKAVSAKGNYETEEIANQSWFRKYALQIFVFNFSLLQFTQMVFAVYFIGVVRTLEKRFGLASTSTGMIMSLNDVVHISVVLFVGYFGRKGHKPIIIGSTSIFLGISALLYASPYFIYGAEDVKVIDAQNEQQFCEARNSSDECSDIGQSVKEYTTNSVFYIFCLASMLNGFGGCAMQVLGMAYVDQNSDKTKSPLYIGIVTSTFALGPLCGFMLAAFCTSFPEDLGETDNTQDDPSWIGAWWLGYVICSALLFVLTIPMFFFPKHIKPPQATQTDKSKEGDGFLDQIREFPKAAKNLLVNKAFLFLLITGILSVYVISGVYINMPRYFEIHFYMPASKANLGTALPGFSGVIGGFIGGLIMTRFKFDVVDSAKMVIFSQIVTSFGIAASIFITCPQINMAGDWNLDHTSVSVDQSCNSNCSCELSKNTYRPVCGADGLTHYSPCYAGCTSNYTINDTTYYRDCACAGEVSQSGACVEACSTEFYTFLFTMFLMSFLSSLGRVPGTVVQFRIVGDDEGSFALGITSFVINLLGFIPGPILFGSLIDSTCVLWQQSCGRRGACLFFDTTRFRYKIFGFSLLFQALSAPFAFGMLWAVKKKLVKQKKISEQESTVIKAPAEERELLLYNVSGV